MTSTSDEPEPVFDLSVESDGQTVIVSASGEVDMVTAPRLGEAASRAIEGAPPTLVLDLSEVTFLASAGISVLVRAKQAGAEQTDVRIVAAGSITLRALQIMGLAQDLAIYPTRDDAIAARR
jgi:anti-anti-sigma factor